MTWPPRHDTGREDLLLEFGEMPLQDALGCILAHRISVPGHVFPKGTVLDAAALRRLNDAGHRHVTAARLAPHEIPENDAARRLSQALMAPTGTQGVLAGQAITGRVYLTAAHAGLFRADRSRIDALNALHEGITLATLADATPATSWPPSRSSLSPCRPARSPRRKRCPGLRLRCALPIFALSVPAS
jgi:hypothetical protein